MRIIDVHTHAFEDAIAARAIRQIEQMANIQARLDGRIAALLASMDAAGVEASVVLSIATKPEQTAKIFDWCKRIAAPRIIPFASVHPADPAAEDWVKRIADAGLRGIKLHPYYQDFDMAEPRCLTLYRRIAACGLVLMVHAGFDVAFPRARVADAARMRRVLEAVPELKLVVTHLGGWEDWDEAERLLIGLPVYIEPSMSLATLPPARAREMLMRHPMDKLLFGTDSPWSDQSGDLARVRGLNLQADRLEALLGGNAARLLNL
ncbi:MAG: amidohydrolase family protein [bacterium]